MKQNQNAPQEAAQEATVEPFETFRERLKPQVRPERTLARMRRALRVDDAFLGEYQALRPYLKPLLKSWPEAIVSQLLQFPEPREQIDGEGEAQLRKLLKAHALQLMIGRFDEDYLDTLEDVALFFTHRGVKSIWVAGAYQQLTCDAIALVSDRADERRALRRRQLITILVSALALELNQIQRVYTLCERAFCEAALRGHGSGLIEGAPASPLDVEPATLELVQDTLIEIAPQAGLMAAAFLKQLFEEAPALSIYVAEDPAAAETGAAEAFAGLGAILARPEQLETALERLARAQPALLSDPARRKAVKAALTHTIRRAAGPRWSPAHEEAFAAVLKTLSHRLGEAATRALAESRVEARTARLEEAAAG